MLALVIIGIVIALSSATTRATPTPTTGTGGRTAGGAWTCSGVPPVART